MRANEFTLSEGYSTEQYKTLLGILTFARTRSTQSGGDGSINIRAVERIMKSSGYQFDREIFTQMQSQFPELNGVRIEGNRMILDVDPDNNPEPDLDIDMDAELDDLDLEDGDVEDMEPEEDPRPDFDEEEPESDFSAGVDKDVVTKMARSSVSI